MAFNPLDAPSAPGPEEGDAPGSGRPASGGAASDGAGPRHRHLPHPAAGYAPGEQVPLGGYAALAGTYTAGLAAFCLWARAAGRRPPRTVPPWDVLLLGAATYKAARLVTKDKITSFVRSPFTRRKEATTASEVMDEPRGSGPRLAVGELVACPFCMSAWVAGALLCGYVAAPRATRTLAAGLTAMTVADWLQYAWSAMQQSAEG